MIIPGWLDGLARLGLSCQIQAVAQRLEQTLLEDSQGGLQQQAAPQTLHRRVVVIEQGGQRIVSRRELHQQLVQVERSHEAHSRHGGIVIGALGARELCGLPTPAPGQQQQLEWLQDRGQSGFWPAHAAGKQRQPAVLARHHFQNPARVAIGPVVQDIARSELDATDVASHSRPRCFKARALSAQFSRTLTQRLRCRRRPSRSFSAIRAERPTRFKRSPLAPITIGFCPSRSTQMEASTVSCPSASAICSTSTATPYGTSWFSSKVSFSRIISAIRNSRLLSVSSPSAYIAGATGRCCAMVFRSASTLSDLSAETGTTATNSWRLDSCAIYGSNRSRGRSWSILFTAAMAGRPDATTRSSARSSSAVHLVASRTSTTRSASFSEVEAVRFIARLSARLPCWCSPGVSTKAI